MESCALGVTVAGTNTWWPSTASTGVFAPVAALSEYSPGKFEINLNHICHKTGETGCSISGEFWQYGI
jgi:hypothetical protein